MPYAWFWYSLNLSFRFYRTDTMKQTDKHVQIRETISGAALPALILFSAIPLYVLGLENAIVFDPPGLLPALNLIFLFICPMITCFFAAKGFLNNGATSLLFIVCGVFAFALGGLVAGFLLPAKGPNAVITIHNTAVFISGTCHFLGALISRKGYGGVVAGERKIRYFVFSIAGILILLVLLTYGVLQDAIPLFFVQHRGPTPLRQVVLGIGFLTFLVSGILFVKTRMDTGESFFFWYAAALFLFSTGLGFVFIQKSFGSPIGWLGRIAQYTGGVYMIIAMFKTARKPGRGIMRFDRALARFFRNQFQVLLEERTAQLSETAARLRHEVEQHKKAKEALRLSASVFANTSEGILITDAQGTIQMVNQAFCDITGYTSEDAVGQNPRILKSDLHDRGFFRVMWQDLVSKGQWQREIWNRRKDGTTYPEWLSISAVRNDDGETTHFISVFHDISDLKQKEDQLRFMAFHDPLTDLPNRKLLYDRAEVAMRNARRTGRKMGLLYMDVDNFKNINDSYGHPFGDEFLCRVRDRIAAVCRESDTFARYGGDEFVIVLNNVTCKDEVLAFSNRILDLFKEPVVIMDEAVYSSISIGLAVFPEDGDDMVTLEKNADLALYKAKQEGKRRSFLFNRSLKDKMLRKTFLENEMQRAVESFTGFSIHYQPKVEIGTRNIYGVEALMRWKIEDAFVSPAEFIPLAEENNLIIPLGRWLMETAMSDLKKIHDQGFGNVSLSINLSGKQFKEETLLETIDEILTRTGFNPGKLYFEITESIPMENTDQAIDIMEKLKKKGIKISMDDFGTGYSSLAFLRRFPLEELKIDRSFIRDIPENPDDAAISKTIIQMADSMNFEVIAEGVEDCRQLKFLEENGCGRVQGFLFYKPLPIDDLAAALEKKMPA